MKRSPPAVDIDHQPGHYIRRLHQISVGIFLQELGEIGITPVQYAALQTVANHPGIDQRTLARTIALDASTTGGVVDRLEARGWLERKTAPEDRRARQLALTDAGVQLLGEAVPAMLGAQDLILGAALRAPARRVHEAAAPAGGHQQRAQPRAQRSDEVSR